MSARYLLSIDAGSTLIKAILLELDAETGQQHLIQQWIKPRLLFEDTIQRLIDVAQATIKPRQAKAQLEICVVGHTPEVKTLTNVGWRISHEEALTAVAKRLSSASTAVVIDIGSQRTFVALGKYGKVSTESFSYGVGLESWNFLRSRPRLEAVTSWISSEVATGEVENYFANKSLYPETLPMSNNELAKEQALARIILHQVAQDLPFPWTEIKTLVVTGAVLAQPTANGQTAAMILDGLAPLGIIHCLADAQLSLMAIGGACEAWSAKEYQIGRTLLAQTLTSLGTIVGLTVPPGNHRRLAKVSIDSGLPDQQAIEVRVGDLIQIPLGEQDHNQVALNADKEVTALNTQPQVVIGGGAGLIIDGRGRPVRLSAVENERRAQLLQWDRQLNAHHQYGQIGENA